MLSDISGQKFGRWTVLQKAPSQYKSAYWKCRCECGKESSVQGRSLRRGASKSCGCLVRELALARIGVNSPGWRGGKTKSTSGYILVQEPSHPAATIGGYVPEHRLVMESMLGRHLYTEETVHHINGIRTDNRPENLELFSSRHGPGQRVVDKVQFAIKILTLYPEFAGSAGYELRKLDHISVEPPGIHSVLPLPSP